MLSLSLAFSPTSGYWVAKLYFEEAYINWTLAQWRNVHFTEELRFKLHEPEERRRTWRREGEMLSA